MYAVNEVFYSLQGEGVRAGTPNVFVRFSGCNMQCAMEPGEKSPGGFDCDTEFVSARKVTEDELLEWIKEVAPKCKSIICTGGEPLLQVDRSLTHYLRSHGYFIAVETNASLPVPDGAVFDWITASPKVAEHCVRLVTCHEVKYVRSYGQALPKPRLSAAHKLISPAFNGTSLDAKTLHWCIQLCLDNPEWALSVQQHKQWGVI